MRPNESPKRSDLKSHGMRITRDIRSIECIEPIYKTTRQEITEKIKDATISEESQNTQLS